MKACHCFCALALAAGTAAADTAAPATPPIALKAQRVLDVRTGRMLTGATVLVEGKTIKSIGPAGTPPAGATLIDLGDVTLLPGFVDAHTHLMADAPLPGGYNPMLLTQSQAARALLGAAHAKKTLHAGFTTVRDVENEGSLYADVALRDAIKKGLVEGPRMQVATRGVVAVGQYHPFGISADLVDFPRGAQMVSGVEEARRAVREQIGNGADLIKVYADWEYPTLTPAELRVVVEEAHKAGRRVAAHAGLPEGIRNAVAAGADSIEHGFEADEAGLKLMKKSGTFLVPTLAVLQDVVDGAAPDAKQRMLAFQRKAHDTVRAAKRLGVPIACGSDASESAMHGRNAREILALHAAGLTRLEALQAATVNGAKLMQLDEKIGALEPGKLADVIAVRGDPLQDLAAVQAVTFVMKGGAVVRRD